MTLRESLAALAAGEGPITSDGLVADTEMLSRLLDAARHLVGWADDLLITAGRWPDMDPGLRLSDADSVREEAGDVLHACAAIVVALDGTADEFGQWYDPA